jgi:hypothetical protein
MENRRLQSLVAERRVGRPVLHGDDGADGGAGAADAHGAAAAGPGKGKAGAAPFVPISLSSNDELETFLLEHQRKGQPLPGKLLDQYRQHNVALLQQMVGSMQALQVHVTKPPVS